MSVSIVSFKITGISPLLMNNPASMQPRQKGFKTKTIPTPEEEAKSKLYINDKGHLYVKTMAFRSSLLGACAGRRLGKVGAKGVIAGSVFTTDTETELLDPKTGKPITDYVINIARAVVQKSGVLRARPEIKAWSCNLDLEIDNDFLPEPSLIEELLNIAGKIRGILDWRPEKMGTYGRFTAKMVENKITGKK
jgi:hypothetical protein